MAVVVSVGPTVEPILLAETKEHLKVENNVDNVLITNLIIAAREHAEMITRRSFTTQTLKLFMDEFLPFGGIRSVIHHNHEEDVTFNNHPDNNWFQHERSDVIFLPRPPLVSVASVQFIDEDGVTQTFAASKTDVDTNSQPGRIVPAFGETWPDTRNVQNAVTITYDSGFGAASAVPQTIKQALFMMIGGWFENREEVVLTGTPKNIPRAVDALLMGNRILTVH